MDGSRFDALSRSLVRGHSRRGLSQVLGGLVLSGLLTRRGLTEAAAKRKKKKKKRPTAPPVSPPTPPPCPEGQKLCGGRCLSVLICCDDTDCAGGRTCQNGTCACPADKLHLCPGSTVCQECCTVTDCRPDTFDDGQACTNGQCVCPEGTRRCPSGSGTMAGFCGQQCCTASDCTGLAFCFRGFCRCNTSAACLGFCASPECEGLCTLQCPAGVAIGQPCCSGTDPLFCRPEFPGDTEGTCQP
jgi:hypothetical protein